MSHRLLHIVPNLEYSGHGTQLVRLCEALSQRDDFHMAVLSLHGRGPLASQLETLGVEVESLAPQPRHLLRWPGAIRRFMRAFVPQTVHTWTGNANLVGRVVAIWERVPRIVASYRSAAEFAAFWQLRTDRTLARWTDAFILHSDIATRENLPFATWGERTIIMPNAISCAASQRARSTAVHERRQRLQQLGLPDNARLILSVGPLTADKRIKDAIWAMDLLKNLYPQASLLIAGDGPHRWRLERYCQQVHVADRVHFLGNVVDLPTLMAACDCVWLPGTGDRSANVLLEAMAVGVPVVASNAPAHQRLQQNELKELGYLVPVGHRAGFARLTHQWWHAEPTEYAATWTAAAARIATQDCREMAARIVEIYQPVAASDARQRRFTPSV